MARIHISGLTSRRLPLPSFTKVKDNTPRLRPVAMLNVNGMVTSVRKAGKDSLKSSHRTRTTAPHIRTRSEEHTSELQSRLHLVCRLLLEKKKDKLSLHIYASARHASV